VLPAVIGAALLGVLGVLFYVSLRRALELFVVRVDATATERVRLVRGRVPPQLLTDLRQVLGKSDAQGTLRVKGVRGIAEVEARGRFSPETLQRVRNLVGLYSVAKLRNGVGPRQT
jgi:hypothetical protein